jgi:hypothetical protein
LRYDSDSVSAGRVVALVAGIIVALVALGLLAGGGTLLWAHTTQRDDDGFYSTRSEPFRSPSYAIRTDDLDVGTEGPDWLFEEGRLATIRLRGRSERPGKQLFLGIGPRSDVERYLVDVDHDVLVDFDVDPFTVEYRHEAGTREPGPPSSQTFWSASGSGAVTWEVQEGDWVAVAMNADGARGIAADISVGAKSDLALWSGIIVLVLGLIAAAGAILLIVFGLRGRRRPAAETSRA